ncbi:CapA family protein [Bdellovibrio sp. HCB-110]|uniref:CapA family protein n=1 Tax=Bdellovibrio sp. HCB-110 TaxID=3391182 RepID=UPI0039B6D53C
MEKRNISLLLCGDVMTGRGIDQILAHPSEPTLHESYVKDATDYVHLAEVKNGPIPRHVPWNYIWGEALHEVRMNKPDAWIVNLETSITSSEQWLNKGINYRMHPDNVACLKKAGIDVCSLANNHVLDWSLSGLQETLQCLRKADLKTCGAGANRNEASQPAILDFGDRGRVLVFSFATESSGVPIAWDATASGGGVNLLKTLDNAAIKNLRNHIQSYKHPRDLIVLSIHWGENWGYEVAPNEAWFARHLIDEAEVDVVYGHSSHHAKGFEIHDGKLILYGCGDFLNDYEGIGGYENFHSELSVMYFVELDSETGKLADLKLVPLRLQKFQLKKASRTEVSWINKTLNREGINLPHKLKIEPDLSLRLSIPH